MSSNPSPTLQCEMVPNLCAIDPKGGMEKAKGSCRDQGIEKAKTGTKKGTGPETSVERGRRMGRHFWVTRSANSTRFQQRSASKTDQNSSVNGLLLCFSD
jgi:hypothetical protein